MGRLMSVLKPLWETVQNTIEKVTQVTTYFATQLVLGLIIVCLLWQLVNFWLLGHWQTHLLKKITLVASAEVALAKPKGYLTSLKKSQHEQLTSFLPDDNQLGITSLSLIKLTLPAVPLMTQETGAITLSGNKALITAPLPNKAKEELMRRNLVKTSVIYQQLSEDLGLDIQIAWPNDDNERQQIFSFLYQCLGMKFGVLNWVNKNSPKITLAKNPYQHSIHNYANNYADNYADNYDAEYQANVNGSNKMSDWLRMAQGQLAIQERHWLQQYDLTGTPVRLMPKKVDWQIAHSLTQVLDNKPLQSFRARYHYEDNHLMLTNIQINGRFSTNNWTLFTRECAIAQ